MLTEGVSTSVNAMQKILRLFRTNSVAAGQVLPKALLTAEIQSWDTSERAQMRDAWHTLVGEGYIAEGHPEGPTLTRRGFEALSGLPEGERGADGGVSTV
jgi:hypothetical protein